LLSSLIYIKSFSSLIEQFPRSRRNYLPPNTTCFDLVVFGSNLSSTVGYPRYTRIVRYMSALSYNLKPILVGLLLSDGWLWRKNNNVVLFGFKQSMPNFKYLWFIFTCFSHYCSSVPCLTKARLKSKVHFGAQFATRAYPFLTRWYEMFYPNGIKVVPLELYYLLDYEALAHWFMGDGTFNKKGLVLQVQSFTVKEAVFLISLLIYKFDLVCSLTMQRGQPTIYISVDSMRKLQPHILPYMHPSMLYKLYDFNSDTRRVKSNY